MTSAIDLEIRINPEYQKLVPSLSGEQYTNLKQSIKKEGYWPKGYPIVINSRGVILDGHNRFKACQELRVIPQIDTLEFKDELLEKQFVIHANLKRRHLTVAQKIEIGHKIKPIYQELAKRNESLGGKGVSPETPLGRVDEVVAKEIGLSRSTFQRGESILREYPEVFDNDIKKAGMKIGEVQKKIKRQERRQELIQEALSSPKIVFPDSAGIQLIHGDFIEKSRELIDDDSIDLIFTDPPYDKEHLYMYSELAKVAERVLKPGGSLIMYVGTWSIHHINRQIEDNSTSLRWNWQLVMLHSGSTRAMHGPKVFVA